MGTYEDWKILCECVLLYDVGLAWTCACSGDGGWLVCKPHAVVAAAAAAAVVVTFLRRWVCFYCEYVLHIQIRLPEHVGGTWGHAAAK